MSFPQVGGRVITLAHEIYTVETPGGELLVAELSGRMRYSGDAWPAVGDYVELRGGVVIDRVLPRRNTVSRKQPGRGVEEQILAANVDVMFIVSALDGDFNPRRIERYLVVAHESVSKPVVILNKADLCPGAIPELGIQAPVVKISALTGGAAILNSFIEPGQTAVLLGSSGVGKSTIVNTLLGRDIQPTGGVREYDNKGRHTTTQRQLLKMTEGWFLIDTPGLREIQPWAGTAAVDSEFDELAQIAAGCQFRDCTHSGEPGCAVEQAVESGSLAASRLENFYKLRREAAFLERQQDERAAADYKRMVKHLCKQIRHHPKYNRS